jgi:NosR/NirI family nitrous oxide reductase transcriptional regulator
MFDLHYLPPEKYLKHEQPAVVVADAPQASTGAAPGASSENQAGPPAAAETPLWQRIWKTRWFDVGLLMAAVGALTVIFFFQDWFMRRPRIFVPLRLGFLAFVLLWLGWLVHAQPSVVNVLTYVNALMSGFKWDYFLMDPLLFILWVGIAAALLFWGRGPFCGWLCPFGALQELTNKAARRLKVPQITVPWGLHERLWPIKYIIFLGLFGVSIYSLALGEQLSEIEPFKTAIVLRFMRAWLLVVFAGVPLRRAVHRALLLPLPLPARRRALAIPPAPDVRLAGATASAAARASAAPKRMSVQAIRPEGQINVNECIYCMHCQLLYWDDHKCPVMIQRRLKRERRAAVTSPTMCPAAAGDPIT